MKKTLVIFCPALHQGYIEFFKKHNGEFFEVFFVHPRFAQELGEPIPRNGLEIEIGQKLFEALGISLTQILTQETVVQLHGKQISMINDDVSRALAQKYLSGEKIEWLPFFLRWDRGSVHAEMPVGVMAANGETEKRFIAEAYAEAENSSDWWRQVGCVIVKDGKVVLKSYNKGCPGDHTPLVEGQVRDYMKAGEKPEFANFIHAEQSAIARAAKEGISLKGADMYITHFPCPVCAKSVAYSGISRVYFGEGSSVVDAKAILEAFGVQLFFIERENAGS